ncbi:Carbamoyl-phosphate synthase large chain [Poriferisphaera corsica]|uniref:Carbamoyl phosphate synthase large chain n=1 Tax=Poriferisphaera corsica TaxID=2528020 RepID=A0A517YR88_9BACT|nr:carbamoyl-phosphate synthase large subunit [Poriferisphaera corsica]QDU32745.1 Carbamoyl-phosphate synthase large chain [Poriferisphaera corsica]
MPKREDIKTILIIGAGPIVIGQGCEFDYSGTQACKALKEEGYNVVLINSNPATIMTDPEFSDRTYIEPITPEAVEKIIAKEQDGPFHIDALLPTLGGQTGLNCACQMFDAGVLDKYGVEMIGANREVIYRAEDRLQFKECMESIGLQCPKAGVAETMDEARAILEEVGLPAIIRPAFTLGGTGGGVAYNYEEFEDIAKRGLDASMNSQILIDQSLLGWKEYELEVMRDKDDNCVVICSIENFDPMGVHTGDSITVAPSQTLTDKEYQRMRDASLAIMRAIGVETGGSNVQFGVNPADGEIVVIEMNPRVSRSSALASKATGFPIAKLAAKLAVGYTLWELDNDVTGETKACFEPTIDYVVTKIPRWTFEKFPEADETLTTQMKSVGEAMSIGRTFKESLQKGIRSMEVKRFGIGLDANDKWLNSSRGKKNADDSPIEWPIKATKLERKLASPSQGRMYYLRYAFKMGKSVEEVNAATGIDPWFLDQLKQLIDFEDVLCSYQRLEDVPAEVMKQAKQWGYSDPQLAYLYLDTIGTENILKVREYRKSLGVEPVYKLVDTCAAEFEASTPYYYSAYESPITQIDDSGSSTQVYDDEIRVTDKKKVIILGGGPNRIGQGIEFDYCCVQAAFAAKELGFEAVMVNSNPETVSTDYDTSDLLFFEPLTFEDVLNICERLNGGAFGASDSKNLVHGVIVSFGGQTPLNLAHSLERAGVPVIGTAVDSIDLAEDRERFAELCDKLNVKQPDNGIAYDVDQAIEIANRISYPVLVRPSFVLGGRAMETVYDDDQLRHYMTIAIGASDLEGQPILVDKFLAEAIECDIDVIADFAPAAGSEGKSCRALVCGVLEHIEEAGIHSGDSACTIPPHSLSAETIEKLKQQSRDMAEALSVRGLMNVQWAIRKGTVSGEDEIYVIEVNPRASRTVPFVGKATGVSWARLAAKVMAGKQLEELGITEEVIPTHTSIKESVFPFSKFPGVDVILGPEMRSTGECMGADYDYPTAFAKSQSSAGVTLPTEGKIFLSVRDSDKPGIVEIARDLVDMGFEVLTTGGTHEFLKEQGVETTRLRKISEGRPNAVDLIKNEEIALILNTPTRKGAGSDEGHLRATAVRFRTGMITTLTAAKAAVAAIKALRNEDWQVNALQDYFPEVARER